MMIAEESTAWQKITVPAYEGGLGFNFKWNMGFANDMYDYVATNPIFRKYHHSKLNFSMMYSFNENFILPVPHDEVVHGQLSLIDKMYGSYEEKFKGMRLFMAHLMAHPGKKLMFMGCEYGQFREWDFENQLEWFMLDYETHRNLRKFTAALNNFYLSENALWQDDFSWNGFRWVIADEAEKNLLAYERIGKNNKRILCLFNFSGADVNDYKFTLPDFYEKTNGKVKPASSWKCVFFTEDKHLGGNSDTPCDLVFENGFASFNLPALSAAYFVPGGSDEITV
jgi:1,4-alpha-glucan branching enzyme